MHARNARPNLHTPACCMCIHRCQCPCTQTACITPTWMPPLPLLCITTPVHHQASWLPETAPLAAPWLGPCHRHHPAAYPALVPLPVPAPALAAAAAPALPALFHGAACHLLALPPEPLLPGQEEEEEEAHLLCHPCPLPHVPCLPYHPAPPAALAPAPQTAPETTPWR